MAALDQLWHAIENALRPNGAAQAPASFPKDLASSRLLRLRDRSPSAADIEWFGAAADTYSYNRGRLSFDRCLGLRTSAKSWERTERDLAVVRAAKVLNLTRDMHHCHQLRQVWERFLRSAEWRAWRDDAAAPACAETFQKHLFIASRFTLNRDGGRSLSAKQIQRLLDKFSSGNV